MRGGIWEGVGISRLDDRKGVRHINSLLRNRDGGMKGINI
jgi:hypothetical protein